MRSSQSLVRRCIELLLLPAGLALMHACAADPSAPADNRDKQVLLGKVVSTEVTVIDATPDSATQDTTLDVVISGTNFASDAVATWTRAGVADPLQIRTNSTRYVNSRQVVANITISSTAALGKWDVVVMARGKGGIGTEMFAIKQKHVSSYCSVDSCASLDFSSLGDLGSNSGMTSDGGGSYIGDTQGVYARIIYHDPSWSRYGDLVFNPSMFSYLPARKLVLRFPAGNPLGLPTGDVKIGPFLNFASIMQMGSDVTWDALNPTGRDAKMEAKSAGQPRAIEVPQTVVLRPGYPTYPIGHQHLHVDVGIPGCEAMEYDSIRMTRVGGLDGFEQLPGQRAQDGSPLGQWKLTRDGVWIVESVDTGTSAGHAAQCYVTKRGKPVVSGAPMNMPFRFVVSEIQQ